MRERWDAAEVRTFEWAAAQALIGVQVDMLLDASVCRSTARLRRLLGVAVGLHDGCTSRPRGITASTRQVMPEGVISRPVADQLVTRSLFIQAPKASNHSARFVHLGHTGSVSRSWSVSSRQYALIVTLQSVRSHRRPSLVGTACTRRPSRMSRAMPYRGGITMSHPTRSLVDAEGRVPPARPQTSYPPRRGRPSSLCRRMVSTRGANMSDTRLSEMNRSARATANAVT